MPFEELSRPPSHKSSMTNSTAILNLKWGRSLRKNTNYRVLRTCFSLQSVCTCATDNYISWSEIINSSWSPSWKLTAGEHNLTSQIDKVLICVDVDVWLVKEDYQPKSNVYFGPLPKSPTVIPPQSAMHKFWKPTFWRPSFFQRHGARRTWQGEARDYLEDLPPMWDLLSVLARTCRYNLLPIHSVFLHMHLYFWRVLYVREMSPISV